MSRQRIDRERNTVPHKPSVEAEARRRLGHNLRLLYAGVLHQPLPERFTRLVDALSADGAPVQTPDKEGSR